MNQKPFLKALTEKNYQGKLPFWFMRQAGRYLPEYKKVRKEAGSFLNLSLNPKLATEVTLQPIKRYNMDAAILFSDILMIPYAFEQGLEFKESKGPVLGTFDLPKFQDAFESPSFHEKLNPIYKAIKQISDEKNEETALIGFAGAPWTVATYMLEGGSSKDFIKSRAFIHTHPKAFKDLIDLLTKATISYLKKHIDSGAEALQIFDSWAHILSPEDFQKWVTEPMVEIVKELKSYAPHIPLIGFPRGAGMKYKSFIEQTRVDAVSLDHTMDLDYARDNLSSLCVLQGNIDSALVYAGGEAMISQAQKIVGTLGHKPFIFNLGHGFHKETPLENVENLVRFLQTQTCGL